MARATEDMDYIPNFSYKPEPGYKPGYKSQKKRARSPPPKPTNPLKGVSRHSLTGKWEACLWVRRERRQQYLGGFDMELTAGMAYDIATLLFNGPEARTNFPPENYPETMLGPLRKFSLDEFVTHLRENPPTRARASSMAKKRCTEPAAAPVPRTGAGVAEADSSRLLAAAGAALLAAAALELEGAGGLKEEEGEEEDKPAGRGPEGGGKGGAKAEPAEKESS